MKKIVIVLILLQSSFYVFSQNITLIGNYTENIVSMCSQGCEFYEIGAFRIENPLDLESKDEFIEYRFMPVMATGEIINAKMLPTIAGPHADNSLSGVYQDVKIFKVDDFSEVDIIDYWIDDENYNLFKSGKDYLVTVSVTNPIGIEMKLKFAIELGVFQSFKIKANENLELSYKVKNNGYSSRVKLQLVKQTVDPENLQANVFTEAVQTGIMFYIEEYIDIEKAHKK